MRKTLLGTILAVVALISGSALAAAAPDPILQTSVDLTSSASPETVTGSACSRHHQLRCGYGLPNPMIGYDSLSEMNKILGFAPLTLDDSRYTNTNKIIISGVTAHLVYQDTSVKSENKVLVRSALKNKAHMQNVSGYFYDNWKTQKISQTRVSVVEANRADHAASWYNDKYTFSLSARDIDKEEFMKLLEQLVLKTEKLYKD